MHRDLDTNLSVTLCKAPDGSCLILCVLKTVLVVVDCFDSRLARSLWRLFYYYFVIFISIFISVMTNEVSRYV